MYICLPLDPSPAPGIKHEISICSYLIRDKLITYTTSLTVTTTNKICIASPILRIKIGVSASFSNLSKNTHSQEMPGLGFKPRPNCSRAFALHSKPHREPSGRCLNQRENTFLGVRTTGLARPKGFL